MATDDDETDDGNELVGEHVRLFRRGKTWYANFQFNKRQYRESLKTTNMKEARRRAAQIDVKLTAGHWKPTVETVSVLDGKLHTFRHSFISHVLLKGIPVAVVKQWVGHVDPHVIDLYTHVHDAASQEAMKKLTRDSKKPAEEKLPGDGKTAG